MKWLRYADEQRLKQLPARRRRIARAGLFLLFVAFLAHTLAYALTWLDLHGFPWSVRSRICVVLMLLGSVAALTALFFNLAWKGWQQIVLPVFSLIWLVMLFLLDTELILAM